MAMLMAIWTKKQAILTRRYAGNANQVNAYFATPTRPAINNDINNPDSSDYIEDIPPPIGNWEFPEGTNYQNNNANDNLSESAFSKILQAISEAYTPEELEEPNDISSLYSNNYCSTMSTEDSSLLFNSLL